MAQDHVGPLGSECDREGATSGFQRKVTPSYRRTKACRFTQIEGKKTGIATGSSRTSEEGCSKDKFDSRKSFLCTPFSSAKGIWRVASHNRSQHAEQVSGSSALQDGDCSVHKSSTAKRRICGGLGPARRLLPHSSSGTISEVPEVLHPRSGLSVRRSLLRASYCTKGLHKGYERNSKVCPDIRDAPTCLSGRLVTKEPLSKCTKGTFKTTSRAAREARSSSQFSKVEFGTQTDFCLFGSQIRSGQGLSFPDAGGTGKTQGLAAVLSHSKGCTSKSTSVFPGVVEPSRKSSSVRQAQYKATTVVPKVLLPASCGSPLQEDSTDDCIFSMPSILGVRRKSTIGKPITLAASGIDSIHGCQSTRLGGTVQQRVCVRPLEPDRFSQTLECSRNDGNYEGSTSLHQPGSAQSSNVCLGQSDYGVSHTETRGHSFLESVSEDTPAVSIGQPIGGNTPSEVDPRQGLDYSGFSEPSEPSTRSRMDAAGGSFPRHSGSVSGDQGRLVRDLREQETTSFCQSLSGRQGTGSRCFLNPLGRVSSLRVSSNQTDSGCASEDSGGQMLYPVGSASMGRSGLVPNNTQPPDRLSEEASNTAEAFISEGRQDVSLQSKPAESARLALVKRSLQEKGFSREVSQRAALSNRQSTRSVYDSRFSKFLEWLDARQGSLEKLTIQEIAEYFLDLFNQQLTVSTIMGYRTAVSSALGLFEGCTVGSHPDISKLFKGFMVERPVVRSVFPDWDLNLVLDVLMKHPFEPPGFGTVQERKFTSWKTAFLVALASANRASEMQAISRSSRDLVFKKHSVQLRAIAGFLAKTQSPLCDSKPYQVADHQMFTGRDVVERLLCPRRMLKYYLNFTGGFKEKSRLFLKCLGEGEVSKSTIASWLKNVIVFAYKSSGKQLQGSVVGHDVRKMATSHAFAAGARLSDILEAAHWSRSTTFVAHYLKDVQRQPDGQYRLGAVLPGSRL